MSDTIELLEAIGRDASLRHESAEKLVDMLEQAGASDALKAAAASGDPSRLSGESKTHTEPPPVHIGHGDGDSDHDGDDQPHLPPAPECGKH